jgi:hypothetical protein
MLKKFHLFLIHYALNRLLSKLSEARVPVDIYSWEVFDDSKTAEIFIGENMGIEISKDGVRLWDGFDLVKEVSLTKFKFDFRDDFFIAVINRYYLFHHNKNIKDISPN